MQGKIRKEEKKLKIEDDEKNERTKAKSFKEEKNKMNSEAKMNNVVSFVSFSTIFFFINHIYDLFGDFFFFQDTITL